MMAEIPADPIIRILNAIQELDNDSRDEVVAWKMWVSVWKAGDTWIEGDDETQEQFYTRTAVHFLHLVDEWREAMILENPENKEGVDNTVAKTNHLVFHLPTMTRGVFRAHYGKLLDIMQVTRTVVESDEEWNYPTDIVELLEKTMELEARVRLSSGITNAQKHHIIRLLNRVKDAIDESPYVITDKIKNAWLTAISAIVARTALKYFDIDDPLTNMLPPGG